MVRLAFGEPPGVPCVAVEHTTLLRRTGAALAAFATSTGSAERDRAPPRPRCLKGTSLDFLDLWRAWRASTPARRARRGGPDHSFSHPDADPSRRPRRPRRPRTRQRPAPGRPSRSRCRWSARLGASGHVPTRPGHPRGLILAPTRELATQIKVALTPSPAPIGLTTTTIFGGVPQARQVSALRVRCRHHRRLPRTPRGPHEAGPRATRRHRDHRARRGRPHGRPRASCPGSPASSTATPSRGQRLLFSATLDNGVDGIVRRFLTNAQTHSVDEVNSSDRGHDAPRLPH